MSLQNRYRGFDSRPRLFAGATAYGTPEFGDMLRRFFADVPGAERNLHILVLGRDDPSAIPDEAPTYVAQRVRHRLGDVRIRGRILAAARTIADEPARDLLVDRAVQH